MKVPALVSLKGTPGSTCAGYSGAGGGGPHRLADQEFVCVHNNCLYFDDLIAVALMTVVAIVCGLIASVIIGGSPPNFPVAGIAFVVTGLALFVRLSRSSR